MKKHTTSDTVIFVASIPTVSFLLSRLVQFFYDAWNIRIPIVIAAILLIAAECIIFAGRSHISRYLKSYRNSTALTLITALLCGAFCICCPGVVLGSCAGGGGAFYLAGAYILMTAVCNILIANTSTAIRSLRRIHLTKTDIIFLLSILALLNAEAFVYCRFMKKIFVWDNAGYFTTVHMLDEIFPTVEYFKTVFRSIFTTDYNYIIAIPANIMCKLFGKSRLVFILSIVNFYVFPLYVAIYLISKRIFKGGIAKTVCVLLCMPYVIFAGNTGFIDIGGAVPAIVAMALYLYCDRDKTSWLTGVLLALCILMRRWYSFYSLSFVATAVIHSIVNKKPKPALEIIGGCAFTLLFFAQSFVSGKLLADYGSMYAAYSLGIGYDIKLFARYFGTILPLVLAVYCGAKAIHSKKLCPQVFVLLQALICFALFVSVQTHGQQHLALYVPAISIALLSLLSHITSRHMLIVALVLCALQTANTFVPRIQPASIREIKRPALLPDFSSYPPIDPYARNILDITEYMDCSIGLPGNTVCLLASSLELNYDTLANAEISLSAPRKHTIDRREYYLPISDVDKRDGLSHTLFDTDYVLVPSSLQLHLAEDQQRVIAVPYRHITDGIGIGAAYKKEDISFRVNDDTQLYVYRRTREISPDERQNIYNEVFNK